MNDQIHSFRLLTKPGDISRALGLYLNRTTNDRQRKSILRAGANEVKKSAITPKSSNPHKFYSTSGKVSTIVSGNLQKSIQVFLQRQGAGVLVGPKYLRKYAAVYGSTQKSASGFYAAALYGSASQFRMSVMEPALNAAKTRAFNAIVAKYAQVHKIAVK